MDARDKTVLTRPQIDRLKQLTNDLKVGYVLGDRVLVKLVEPFTDMDRVEKEGRLIIPETVKEANQPMPTTGVVVAIGAGVNSPYIAEGDMIMFSRFAGSDCYFNEEHFRIMEIREVLCTLHETRPEVPTLAPIA